jgi:transcriptional regulator with XRE-family HTH domain/KaiC/GvpD/RAD55 family RecA-like ATPase
MFKTKTRVSSGVRALDKLLGGLFIGDNVVWYDDAGSLASIFSYNFIQESQARNKSLIYVTFDSSPKKIIEELGPLAEKQHITILDCFTNGKGDGSEVFSKFYEKDGAQWPYRIIKVTEPAQTQKVAESIYSLHQTMQGDVRLVFESLTGMQDLWGAEEEILKFYTRSCPRLYELDTIAYWIIEKGAHSDRLKAHINQTAQVAIDLRIRRGRSALTILKADKRRPGTLNTPVSFWNDGTDVVFEEEGRKIGHIDVGKRTRALRTKQGLSQKELAGLVGVTPSTISQIESNSIYPSLPALFKIAQTLNVEIGSFFQTTAGAGDRVVFSAKRTPIPFPDMPKQSIKGWRLSPADFESRAEPYLIEIAAGRKLPAHFFAHKGEEMGYALAGQLEVTINGTLHPVRPGDVIYLTSYYPTMWRAIGPDNAQLLWVKIS